MSPRPRTGGKSAAPRVTAHPTARDAARTPERAGSTLLFLLGDQLDRGSPTLADLGPHDHILMAEVRGESTHVPSHIQRTVLFLSAMRHHAQWLEKQKHRVRYVALTDAANTHTLGGELARAINELKPSRVRLIRPGEHRVLADLRDVCDAAGVPLEVLEDTHFVVTPSEFDAWAAPRKSFKMEDFYREQRRRLNILIDADGEPEGGRWNFDAENRDGPGAAGPGLLSPPLRFAPDAITRSVIADVRRILPNLPGRLDNDDFGWPVTREQALDVLHDFIARRLHNFGRTQDAMWRGEWSMNHALLSSSLNLKLLHPRECVDAAVEAYRDGKAPLAAVEGFIRQIIGWREFIRGIYFREGPDYADRNWLQATTPLPELFWTGKTDLRCLHECVNEVLDRAYGHHIQRLMVIGNFTMLLGVNPRAVSDWFLGMYVDAVDWVTLPNVLGMSQHADGTATRGPVVGTKPYAASGQYIKRMSNYCSGCRYDPTKRTGDDACPFTTLYWDFLLRHRARFKHNHRMRTILANLDRFSPSHLQEITISAQRVRRDLAVE
ncbi:MAG: cryptochrome/photolyase family protein [Planctomycetota bacterium]|nr:cryptochrome/photolyase family protein [Planctomycetota bacterium]